MTRPAARLARPALALALAALAGCSDAFAPVAPDSRVFALDAVVDSRRAVQTVRVQDLARPLVDTALGDVRVTLAELRSGREAVLRDSAVTLTDGSPGVAFTGAFAVGPGDRVRLRAARPSGESSETTVELPAPTLDVTPADSVALAVLLRVRGLASAPTGAAVRVRGRRTDTGQTAEATLPLAITFTSDGSGGPVALSTAGALGLGDGLRRALGLPASDPAGRAELLEAAVVGVVRSAAPAPVERGVGGARWTLAYALRWRVEAGLLARARLGDGQAP